MSINVELYVWDYNTLKSGHKIAETLLKIEESLEFVNYLLETASDVDCKIVDLGDRSFAISYERFTVAPRMDILTRKPLNHEGYLYWFKGTAEPHDKEFQRLRGMVRAYAIAYPDLTSNNVKAYLANPLSLV